jgi:hypothetical protein
MRKINQILVLRLKTLDNLVFKTQIFNVSSLGPWRRDEISQGLKCVFNYIRQFDKKN